MSAARWIPDLSTPEAFVSWIDKQPYKYEMIMGRLVMMTGGTNPHATIAVNAIAVLHAHLRGSPCRVYNGDFMVHLQAGNHFYPDVSVVCDERRDFTDRPILVIEALSKSTRREDVGPKLTAYRQVQGLRAILYLHQDQPLAWLWPEGEERQVIEGLHGTVEIPALGLTLPMAELYESVELREEG